MATTDKNNGEKNVWDEKELGCLWRRETSSQEKYLTGVLKADKLRALLEKSGEDIQLVCFSNKNKSKDTHPDLRIYLSEKKKTTTSSAPAPARTAPAPARTAPVSQPATRRAPVQQAPPVDANELV